MAQTAHNPYCVDKALDFETGSPWPWTYMRNMWTPSNRIVPYAVPLYPPRELPVHQSSDSSHRPPPFNPYTQQSSPHTRQPYSMPQPSAPPQDPPRYTEFHPPPLSRWSPIPPAVQPLAPLRNAASNSHRQPSASAQSRRHAGYPSPPHSFGLSPNYTHNKFDRDYRDPFYDKHLLYEAVGLYREDSIVKINETMRAHFAEAIALTNDPNQVYAWGKVIIIMVANEKFANKERKESYDKNGDPEFNRASPTRKSEYADFYKNHCLYEAVGAQMHDNYQVIAIALKNSAYRVLQDKRTLKNSASRVLYEEVRQFRTLWYNACHILMNEKSRNLYDRKSDKDYRWVVQ